MAAAIELASGLHERLIERLDLRRTDINRMTDAELWTYAQRHLQQLIDQSEARHSPERGLLERQILQEVVGLGAVEDLLSDDSISEIMINGPGDVFVERHGRIERMASRFSSTQSLAGVIERLLQRTGRRVDESSPMVDARLPDGSRINVIVPPLALSLPRRFPSTAPRSRSASSDSDATDCLISSVLAPCPLPWRISFRSQCARAGTSWFPAAPVLARQPCSIAFPG